METVVERRLAVEIVDNGIAEKLQVVPKEQVAAVLQSDCLSLYSHIGDQRSGTGSTGKCID